MTLSFKSDFYRAASFPFGFGKLRQTTALGYSLRISGRKENPCQGEKNGGRFIVNDEHK